MGSAYPPLRHLALAVHDQHRSEQFYCSLFGFRPLRRSPQGDLTLVGPDGFSLALGATDEALTLPPFLHFGFDASSPSAVQAYHDEVAGLGVEILAEWNEPDYVSFKCRDPDGYIIEIAWEPQP